MDTWVYACINGQYIISNGYIETWGTLAMLTAHCKPKIEPQCEAEIHESYGTDMTVFGPETCWEMEVRMAEYPQGKALLHFYTSRYR